MGIYTCFIDQNVIEKPETVEYVSAMVFHFDSWSISSQQKKPRNLVELLTAIPDVDVDLYRLFEVETSAFKNTTWNPGGISL